MRRRIQSVVYATLLAGSALLSGCASVAHPPIRADLSTDALESGTPVRTSAPAGLAHLVLAQAAPKKDVDPAALFSRLGCTLCHASGARYHDRIVKAAGKPEQELAKWIRNPEQFVPGTAMPTYASLVDEPTALLLARWIRSGGPAR
jgi:cytochrome c551/c552